MVLHMAPRMVLHMAPPWSCACRRRNHPLTLLRGTCPLIETPDVGVAVRVAGGCAVMLKKSNRMSFGWAGVLVGAAFALATACGDTGNSGGTCTPNEEQACHCSNGDTGFQVCESSGKSFTECNCNGGGGTAGTGGTGG